MSNTPEDLKQWAHDSFRVLDDPNSHDEAWVLENMSILASTIVYGFDNQGIGVLGPFFSSDDDNDDGF
jgi:hypothetical protein